MRCTNFFASKLFPNRNYVYIFYFFYINLSIYDLHFKKQASSDSVNQLSYQTIFDFNLVIPEIVHKMLSEVEHHVYQYIKFFADVYRYIKFFLFDELHLFLFEFCELFFLFVYVSNEFFNQFWLVHSSLTSKVPGPSGQSLQVSYNS